MFAVEPAHVVLAVLAGSLILFVTDALRFDLVALLVVLVLAITGTLEPQEAFRGFASPAVVLIAAMYVFGHALYRCGVAEAIGRKFLEGSGSELSIVLRVTLIAGLFSAVISNTGVVATLIPVCMGLARRHRIPVSRLMMPMAFGSLLGGLVTVIGTSSNVVINDVIGSAGPPQHPFELFEFSTYGLGLLLVGCLYFLGPGRLLLPRSRVDQTLAERYQVPKFVTEILVEPTSTLINRNVADCEVFERHDVTVLGIVRAGGESTVLAPGPYNRIRADDTLILQGAPEDIVRLSGDLPLKERKSVETAETRLYSDDVSLVEVVVPGGSGFVGRTLLSSEFRTRTGLNVVAISKHGEVQLRRLQAMPLEVGDTLLVQGHRRDVERARKSRQLLVLDEVIRSLGRSRAVTSLVLLGAVLLAATVTDVDLAVLALAGALGLVLTRTVRPEEIYRAVDWQVLILVGGMLALGEAFERYELSGAVAGWLTGLGQDGLGPRALVLVLLLSTALLTQVLNNVSTAVIMTPVAIDLAATLDVDSRAFLMAVLTGTSLAFMSPVAHQANAMVMGPGGYRYRDYLRVGTPLALVTVAVAAWLIPLFWPLV